MTDDRQIFAWIMTTARALVGETVGPLWIYLDKGLGLSEDLQEFPLPWIQTGDQGLPGRVARTGVPIVCQDVWHDEYFAPYYQPIFPETNSQWCFPLLAKSCAVSGEPRQVLCMESSRPSRIGPEIRRPIDLLAEAGGLQIAARRGIRKIQRAREVGGDERWRLEQQIQELSGIRPEPAIRKMFDSLAELLGSQGISFWQYNEVEDKFCHPLFSSGAPEMYQNYPSPGPWGPVGRALASGTPVLSGDISVEDDLRASRFMRELGIAATAYIPAFLPVPTGEPSPRDASKAQGILFVNFSEKHEFSVFEASLLQKAANAAMAALHLRSLARRHRLAQRFDLGEGSDYPGKDSSSRSAVKAVVETFASYLGFRHGVLYIQDRPGSIFLRSAWTQDLGESFPGRYLESHPLLGRLREVGAPLSFNRAELSEIVNVPGPLGSGEAFAFPLLRQGTLLGFCIFANEAPAARTIQETSIRLCQEALGTLLELDQQAHSRRRQISLLAQFLRIYEYAAHEVHPEPLLQAFLDALLEGRTADACSIYLDRGGESGPLLAVARGDADLLLNEPMPSNLHPILETGEPRFDDTPSLVPNRRIVQAQATLPLTFQGRRYGVLCVEYHAAHPFTEDDRWFFGLLAHQLGQSLHYFQGNQGLLNKVGSLAQSGARIAALGSPKLQELQEEVSVWNEGRKLAEQARKFTRADFVELFVLQDDDLVLQASHGGDATASRSESPLRNPTKGLIPWAWHKKQRVLVADVFSEYARSLGYSPTPTFSGSRSQLVVPVLDDSRVVGIINLESRTLGAFNEADIHFVEAIASQAVILRRVAELQQARRQLREERDLLVRVNEIAQGAASHGQTVVLERILQALRDYIEANFLAIHLLTDDRYAFDHSRSVAVPEDASFLRGLTLDNSIIGHAVHWGRRTGEKALLIRDIRRPPEGFPPSRHSGSDSRGAKLVVFLGRGQDIHGIINIEHADPEALERQVELVKAVVQGIENALSLALSTETAAGQELRQRMVQESNELLQLLSSTVFHDAPQLVQALKNRYSALDRAFSRFGQDASPRLRRAYDRTLRGIPPVLRRLERLSTALPRYTGADKVDLAGLVKQTFDPDALTALPYYDNRRCQVVIDAPEMPLYIYESANWVQHILENLAVNSFRAMSKTATRQQLLTVRVHARQDLAVVQVEDNGPGISDETAQKLGVDKIEHAGKPGVELGIFHKIATEHVRRHGGVLQLVRTEAGKGATFELRYPIFTGERNKEGPASPAPGHEA